MTWTRRIFIRDTLLGWLGLLVGPAAYSLLRRALDETMRDVAGSAVVGKVSDFRNGAAKIFLLGRDKVIIARAADGRFHAVSGVCTHLGCSVRFQDVANAESFICNCHASRFDLDGVNLSGPAPSPLRRFDAVVSGEDVVVSRKQKSVRS